MKWMVGVLYFLLLIVLVHVRPVSAEEGLLSEIFTVRNINVEYVALKLTKQAGSLRVGRAAKWSGSCRNLGSAVGNDFCWQSGKQHYRIPLPEFGWAAYAVLRPRVLWQFDNMQVRFPPGLTYEGDFRGGLTLRQHGKVTSVGIEVKF